MADKGNSSLFGKIDASEIIIPSANGSKEKVDALFLLRRWCDDCLNAPPEDIGDLLKNIKWKDKREPRNFIKSYEALQSLKRKFLVATRTSEIVKEMASKSPSVIIVYNLVSMYGTQELASYLKLTRIYRNVMADSLYSAMPGVKKTISESGIDTKVLVVPPDMSQKSLNRYKLHILNAEDQVVKKILKKGFQFIEVVEPMGLEKISYLLNSMLEKRNGAYKK